MLGDLRSQVAACEAGERGLLEMIAGMGLEGFQSYAEVLIAYTERYTRAEIAKLPDGVFHFTDHIDGGGIEAGAITIQVAVRVSGDEMETDFAGTSPQVKGAINSVHAFTASATWDMVRSILDADIPNNDGYFRPITVTTLKGSVVDPVMLAAVAARGLTADRVADAVSGALAQVAPDQTAPDTAVSFDSHDAEGRPVVFVEGIVGSWGGGPDRDGMDACTGIIVNYSNTPAEMLVTDQPLRIERYGFVADSGGPGRIRGGLALERHIRFLADEAMVQVRSDHHHFAPYGLAGGAPGAHAALCVLRANGGEDCHDGHFRDAVRSGDILAVRVPSGSGFGDPLDRDPARVLADVIDGRVTLGHATATYGVVLSGTPPAVDVGATRNLRARRRSAGP